MVISSDFEHTIRPGTRDAADDGPRAQLARADPGRRRRGLVRRRDRKECGRGRRRGAPSHWRRRTDDLPRQAGSAPRSGPPAPCERAGHRRPGIRADESQAAIPDPRKTTTQATYQRTADLTSLNTSAPSGARMPTTDTAGGEESAERNHDNVGASKMSTWPTRSSHGSSASVRRRGSPRAGRRSTRAAPAHGSEREIQSSPKRRDRQDQHRDLDQQRLRARRSSSSRMVRRRRAAAIHAATCIADVTRAVVDAAAQPEREHARSRGRIRWARLKGG